MARAAATDRRDPARRSRRAPSRASAPQLAGPPAGRGPRALDPVVHERTRLGILSALVVSAGLSHPELRALLDTTDGNLSVHARKLEQTEYVTCSKTFAGRMPRTEYRITPAGRKALEAYLAHMEAIIRATRR